MMTLKHVLFISAIILFSCTDNNLNTEAILEGKWVEVNTKTDTLTFGLLGGQESMTLSRGVEMINGSLLPKRGSGSYDYKLITEKISLRYHLSSNSAFTDYHFKYATNRIEIENFYSTSLAGTIQTFEKIN
ncbi:MAG: hypothetical protein OEW67_06750 [Cyclobacteriaceae bacterium]|nr:hypothetical protein [Cyclobacteriaceae bacterium]